MKSINYSFPDLVDIYKIKNILISFYELRGIPLGLVDLDGNILTCNDGSLGTVGWQDICLNFHRKHPESLKKCINSNIELANGLKVGEKYYYYTCHNGMEGIAVPIYIENEHMANLVTGQFFFKSQDIEFFRKHAYNYGFDEDKCLKALSKVPVFSAEFVESSMRFLTELANVIGEMGLEKKKLLDSKLALQAIEEKYNIICQNTGDVIWLLDIKSFRFIYVSPSSSSLCGYTPEEILKQSLKELITSKYYKLIEKKLTRRIAAFLSGDETARVMTDTVDQIHKNGTIIPTEMVTTLLTNKEGHVDRILGVSRDIKERKKTENMLRFQANILNNVRDCVIVYDLQGRIIYWNKGAEAIYGYLEEEIIGKNIKTLYLNMDEDQFTSDLREIIESGEYSGEWEGKRKDGSKVYVDIRETVMHDVNDEIIGVIGVSKDIGERKKVEKQIKRSEAYYRTIFENTGTATIIVEEDTTISLVNAEFEKLYGYLKEEIEGKQSWKKFASSDYVQKMEEYHNLRRIDPSLAPRNYEFKFVDKFGNVKEVFTTVAVIPGTKKSLISLLDVTDKKMAENKIRESLKEKEVLLKEIHHRVKNNLQIISSLLNLQTRYVEGEETINVLKESQSRVKTMAVVHEKLYQSTNLKDIDFKEYIENLVSDLFYSYGVKRGIIAPKIHVENLKMDIDTAIPCGLIINELVTNSLKYAFPSTEICQPDGTFANHDNKWIIKVELKRLQNKLELIVSDNGIGLPEDVDMENIETLGLKMVNILVNQLGGTLELNRTCGTEFRIMFNK